MTATVQKLHARHTELQKDITDTEDRFIAAIAQAHQQGVIDWNGLVTAYDVVRAWSTVNGLGSFANRWEAHIQYNRNTLVRFARSMPTGPNGTWSGSTGWDGLDTAVCPQRGMHVAFVLFGNGDVPVHIGFTEQFRDRLKTLARNGLSWTAWFAQLCDARDDAVEVRRELVRKYGEPNIAAQPSTNRLSPAGS